MKKLRNLPATATTHGTCVDCGRRGLLHKQAPQNCVEPARIPACIKRREKRERQTAANQAAVMLAAMEAEYGALPE